MQKILLQKRSKSTILQIKKAVTFFVTAFFQEPLTRFELVTYALRMRCSTD